MNFPIVIMILLAMLIALRVGMLLLAEADGNTTNTRFISEIARLDYR